MLNPEERKTSRWNFNKSQNEDECYSANFSPTSAVSGYKVPIPAKLVSPKKQNVWQNYTSKLQKYENLNKIGNNKNQTLNRSKSNKSKSRRRKFETIDKYYASMSGNSLEALIPISTYSPTKFTPI